MRISDWSSDVCSSDLHPDADRGGGGSRRAGGDPVVRDCGRDLRVRGAGLCRDVDDDAGVGQRLYVQLCRSEEHTSELQSLMRISYAVFCLKKKNTTKSRSV